MAIDAALDQNDLLKADPFSTGEGPINGDSQSSQSLKRSAFIVVGAGTTDIDWIFAEPLECAYTETPEGTLDVKSWNMPYEGEMYMVSTPCIVQGGKGIKVAQIRRVALELAQTLDWWPGMFYGSASERSLTFDSEENRDTQSLSPELDEALSDLALVIEEAQENDWVLPSVSSLRSADRILRELYDISPRRFEAYSMPNGNISVVAKGLRRHWVLLSIEPNGKALCVVCINGEESHEHYDGTDSLPDDFVRDVISRIGNR